MKKLLSTMLLASSATVMLADAPTIITQQPAGELRTYDRSGYAWYDAGSSNRKGLQTGTIDIVFAADNKVYLKRPISKLETDAWVEGTLNEAGSLITVPLGQCLGFNADQTDYVIMQMLEYDEDYEEFSVLNRVHEVTYTISEEKITLNGTSSDYTLGAVWSSDNEWTGYCDYASVYTLHNPYEIVTPPADLETAKYILSADAYMSGGNVTYQVNLGISGDEMYIQGIFNDAQDAWIVGTRSEDGSYSFDSGQFLGKYYNKDYFSVSTMLNNTQATCPFILTFNEETEAFENNDQYLILSGHRLQVYLTEALSNISLTKMNGEGIVFQVPYTEDFQSNASVSNYTIIDGNNDGIGWYYNPSMMRVCYDSMMARSGSDDWFITPAIALEEGVNYTFTVYARSFTSSLAEKFEVKAGIEPTSQGMQLNVIAPTEVATGDFTPFSGNLVAEETGNYYFGVHAITETDEMTLYLNKITVEVGPAVGIKTINDVDTNNEDLIYTIDGKRINQISAPGLYIVNGKKIIIR